MYTKNAHYYLADTVVLTHPSPGLSQTPYAEVPLDRQEVLEKPSSKEDNLRMLLDLNGGVCEVVTGVTVGVYTFPSYVYDTPLTHHT